jgi:hypothetical protein
VLHAGVEVQVKGLLGGHSGINICEDRGAPLLCGVLRYRGHGNADTAAEWKVWDLGRTHACMAKTAAG